MQTMQAADLIAIVKNNIFSGSRAGHRPVAIPNTLNKIADNAILQKFQNDYIKKLMPRQLRVGFKFATELLLMGLRMTLHLNPDFILVVIDLENAYKKIWRAAVLCRHL